MRALAKLGARFVWVAMIAFTPAAAYAQATIAGIVRDTSGAVLPGVTVEAASPALIEKVRSVVTDDTGQFQIVNLVPGTYAVTFTLPGFNSVTRTGVELSGSFAAKIDAEMRVGAVRRRQHRPPFPFQPPHRLVVIDRHDQTIRFGGRRLQVANVAHVQQVEASVGEGDGPSSGTIGGHPLDQLGA